MTVILEIVACVLATDFISGFVHWLEDCYGHHDVPLMGALVTRRNNLHHQDPSLFTRFGYWHGSWLLVSVGLVLGFTAWLLGSLSWQVALVLVLGANANHVHKWSHRSRSRNGWLISRLMDWHLLPSQRHHARHHRGTENTTYCVLTPYLNPALDRARFWLRLEQLVQFLTGVSRRDPNRGAPPVGYQARRQHAMAKALRGDAAIRRARRPAHRRAVSTSS